MTINLNPALFHQYRYSNPSSSPAVAVTKNDNAQSSDETAATEASSGLVTLGKRQSPEDTAAAILAHVEQGLSNLKAAGADSERLQQRLDAAREGIAAGYAEATSMLDDMGMLDDELQASIDSGRTLVDDGLQAMQNSIGQSQSGQQSRLLSGQSSLNVTDSLSLQVMTQDGDRVQVSFSQAGGFAANQTGSALTLSASHSQNWQMDVSGDLSQAEQDALSSLFNNVQSLSEQFFAGDIGAALQSAMDIGFDGNQLAVMSLQLTQTTVATSTRFYESPQLQLPTAELESLKAPLASYVDRYEAALDKLGILSEPSALINELVQQLVPEDERLGVWNAFHDGLNALLQ